VTEQPVPAPAPSAGVIEQVCSNCQHSNPADAVECEECDEELSSPHLQAQYEELGSKPQGGIALDDRVWWHVFTCSIPKNSSLHGLPSSEAFEVGAGLLPAPGMHRNLSANTSFQFMQKEDKAFLWRARMKRALDAEQKETPKAGKQAMSFRFAAKKSLNQSRKPSFRSNQPVVVVPTQESPQSNKSKTEVLYEPTNPHWQQFESGKYLVIHLRCKFVEDADGHSKENDAEFVALAATSLHDLEHRCKELLLSAVGADSSRTARTRLYLQHAEKEYALSSRVIFGKKKSESLNSSNITLSQAFDVLRVPYKDSCSAEPVRLRLEIVTGTLAILSGAGTVTDSEQLTRSYGVDPEQIKLSGGGKTKKQRAQAAASAVHGNAGANIR